MDVARARFIDLEQAAAPRQQGRARSGRGAAPGRDRRREPARRGVELLAQLEREFAGSAEEASGTATAAQDRLQVSLENVQEAIGTGLLPAVAELADALADAADMVAGPVGDGCAASATIKIPTIEIPFATSTVPGTAAAASVEHRQNGFGLAGAAMRQSRAP